MNGFEFGQHFERLSIGLRQWKGGHRVDGLSLHTQAFAAGGQHFETRALSEQCVDQSRTGIQKVFTIVKKEQGGFVAERVDQLIQKEAISSFTEIEYGGDGLGDQLGVGQRVQGNKPDPIRKFLQQLLPHPQRQAGLADAAGSHECDKTPLAKESDDILLFLLASKECRKLVGKVVTGEGGFCSLLNRNRFDVPFADSLIKFPGFRLGIQIQFPAQDLFEKLVLF